MEELKLRFFHLPVPAGPEEPLALLVSCAPLLWVHLIKSDIVADRVLFLLQTLHRGGGAHMVPITPTQRTLGPLALYHWWALLPRHQPFLFLFGLRY